MTIKGVFFDFFGTLAIPKNLNLKWSEWYPSVFPLYKKQSINISSENFKHICETFWSNRYEETGNGFTLFEKRLLSQLEFFGVTLSSEKVKELAYDLSEAWFYEHMLDGEASELLGHFKQNMKVALITNFDHPPLIHLMLKRYNIAEYFDSVIISGDVGVKKPMPEIFLPALKDTGLTNSEVIYIGDSIMDFRAALHAGILPIIIRREGQHDPTNPGSIEKKFEATDNMLLDLHRNGQIEIITTLSDAKKAVIKHL